MKKLLLIVLLSTLFLSHSTTFAQIKAEATVWTLNLGIAFLSNAETNTDITGYSFNTTIEKFVQNTGWSIGMNLGFNRGEDVVAIGSNAKSYNTLSSTTLFLTGKYSFQKSSNIIPYIGFGFGWSFSTKETAIFDVSIPSPNSLYYYETNLTGYVITVPVGVNFYVDRMVFLGLNIAPFYSENSYYKDDLNWAVNFSVGFQF